MSEPLIGEPPTSEPATRIEARSVTVVRGGRAIVEDVTLAA